MLAFNRPVVSLLYLSLQFSMLTWNIPQTIQISLASSQYRSSLSLKEADDTVLEPQTDDHIGLGPYWLGPGPSCLRLSAHWHLDNIVVIDSESKSEVDLEETIQVVSLSPLST